MNNIEFVSMIPGLEDIEECRPKPAKHFIPQWFSEINKSNTSTVKNCPSFPDYFSLGYILPMWCDSKLIYNSETKAWNWETASDNFKWDIHQPNQFTEWVTPNLHGSEANFVFKADCPWRIITPKGWSVLQLPLYYHFNQKWSILPGVIDTDIYNEINQQVLYHGDGQGIQIDRGDPFVLYIPYKRNSKIGLKIRSKNKNDDKIFKKKDIDVSSKFRPNGLYRKWQRERDKSL